MDIKPIDTSSVDNTDVMWWAVKVPFPASMMVGVNKDKLHRLLCNLITTNVDRLVEECRGE